MAIPLFNELILWAVSFKKSASVLAGITDVVTGVGPELNDTIMEPRELEPSEIEIKLPFSNFSILTRKERSSTSTVF